MRLPFDVLICALPNMEHLRPSSSLMLIYDVTVISWSSSYSNTLSDFVDPHLKCLLASADPSFLSLRRCFMGCTQSAVPRRQAPQTAII